MYNLHVALFKVYGANQCRVLKATQAAGQYYHLFIQWQWSGAGVHHSVLSVKRKEKEKCRASQGSTVFHRLTGTKALHGTYGFIKNLYVVPVLGLITTSQIITPSAMVCNLQYAISRATFIQNTLFFYRKIILNFRIKPILWFSSLRHYCLLFLTLVSFYDTVCASAQFFVFFFNML